MCGDVLCWRVQLFVGAYDDVTHNRLGFFIFIFLNTKQEEKMSLGLSVGCRWWTGASVDVSHIFIYWDVAFSLNFFGRFLDFLSFHKTPLDVVVSVWFLIVFYQQQHKIDVTCESPMALAQLLQSQELKKKSIPTLDDVPSVGHFTEYSMQFIFTYSRH